MPVQITTLVGSNMTNMQAPVLQQVLNKYQHSIPQFSDFIEQLAVLLGTESDKKLSPVIKIYDQIYAFLENELWHGDNFDITLEWYQALFREQEKLIADTGVDDRKDFILSIPVADRPEHLRSCLDSIYQLCVLYAYGGKAGENFKKVKVIVAEDSKQSVNIEKHIAIAAAYSAKGLPVIHLGQQEQYQLLQAIPEEIRLSLGSLLTTQPEQRFFLKGQAANRNLSYLKFLQLTENKEKTLYYLVDSDQSFKVNRQTGSGEQSVSAVNYFYYINRIFSKTDTTLLTGKLVGDPPVSPSVMAVNFLKDVTVFLQRLAAMKPESNCQYHQADAVTDDAAYHDMAGLFGFENKQSYFDYPCHLQGDHSNLNCLEGFSSRVNAFFFGQHLTRKTSFNTTSAFTDISPARTIYPGNYIVNYDGLKYIIPFGNLRLRMSGPTAGRLIQAEIGQRFASANLPMLHTRTQQQDLAHDFRPGVDKQAESINLTDEFERQFFGDLMLFTVVELTARTDCQNEFERETVTLVIDKVELELLALYQSKHDSIKSGNNELKRLLNDSSCWWYSLKKAEKSIQKIQSFIDNIELNFGEQSEGYLQIQSKTHRDKRKQQIINALLDYHQSRQQWDLLFPL